MINVLVKNDRKKLEMQRAELNQTNRLINRLEGFYDKLKKKESKANGT